MYRGTHACLKHGPLRQSAANVALSVRSLNANNHTVSVSVSNETKQPVCRAKSSGLEDPEPPPESPLSIQPSLPEILCAEVHAVESPAAQFATGPEDNATAAAILLLSDSRKTTTGREEEGGRKRFFFFFFPGEDSSTVGFGSNPMLVILLRMNLVIRLFN